MSNEQQTVTVRRRDGAPRTTHVAAGAHSVEFDGDGPFHVPAETWRCIESIARESFEAVPAADAPASSAPPTREKRPATPARSES